LKAIEDNGGIWRQRKKGKNPPVSPFIKGGVRGIEEKVQKCSRLLKGDKEG